MLVITRMPLESFKLTIPPSNETREVMVQIVKVRGDHVTVGVEAPKEIRILRSEIEPLADADSAA